MYVFKHRANRLIDPYLHKNLEIDVKSNGYEIVLGHNWNQSSCTLIDYLKNCSYDTQLAINIKESGLAEPLREIMNLYSHKIKDFFFFDMAMPDSLPYIKLFGGNHVAVRLSEFENKLISPCKWIWLDFFKGSGDYEKYYPYTKNYKIVVVSPELHGIKKIIPNNILKNFWGICTDNI